MFIVYRHIDHTLKEDYEDPETDISLQDIVQIGIELIGCVENVHSTDYVHLDLKMDNIMISEDFKVHLIDYGQA